MAAAIEAINGLTGATETANVLSKSAGGVMETIGKSLSTLVTNILQPLFPIFIYLIQQLVLKWIEFKAWWDGLPGWIDEKVIKPVAEWIDTYIVKPFWTFFNDILVWIDTYIVKPFWKFFADIYTWIDTYIVKPFWKAISDIQNWVNTYIVQPFWNAIYNIQTWVNTYIVTPFWNGIYGIQGWINGYIVQPFWNAFNYVTGWVSNLKESFRSMINGVITYLNNAVDTIPGGGYLPNIPPVATGGYVAETGVAVIHKGETVVPAGKSGNTITLNFYGYQDDKFIQKVKDVMRSQGTVYNL